MLNGLDLFSGIGGLAVALEPWVRPIAYCENDRYCQASLLCQMRQGGIARAPIWDDVSTLQSKVLNGKIDIIYGGFPCQDISVAGRGAGLEGQRSGLFFEVIRLIDELRPTFVFLENVPAIRTRGAERVVKELASRGYDCRWDVVSAQEVGAPHLRKRWFLLAYASGHRRHRTGNIISEGFENGSHAVKGASEISRTIPYPQRVTLWNKQGWSSGESGAGENVSGHDGSKEPLADSEESRLEGRRQGMSRLGGGWSVEPDVGRVAHGVPMRVDRLRGLGNSVVPAQAREAFKRLSGL